MKLACFLSALLAVSGCKTSQEDSVAEVKDVSNIVSMVKDSNGKYLIYCDDGRQETRSSQEIIDNQVCLGSAPLVGLVYGESTNCSTAKLIDMVDSSTDCDAMQDPASWSIKVGDQCESIYTVPAATAKSACLETKALITRPRVGVVYGESTNCSTSRLVSIVDKATDCSSIQNTSSWSIKIGDRCESIYTVPAATSKSACLETKASIARPRMGIVYGESTNCSTAKLIAIVDSTTDCKSMQNVGSWSIKVGDDCESIYTTPAALAKSACIEVKAKL